MNYTRKNCKYWNVCGSNENCKGCKGFVKKEKSGKKMSVNKVNNKK